MCNSFSMAIDGEGELRILAQCLSMLIYTLCPLRAVVPPQILGMSMLSACFKQD